jgi:hypothetical protein
MAFLDYACLCKQTLSMHISRNNDLGQFATYRCADNVVNLMQVTENRLFFAEMNQDNRRVPRQSEQANPQLKRDIHQILSY